MSAGAAPAAEEDCGAIAHLDPETRHHKFPVGADRDDLARTREWKSLYNSTAVRAITGVFDGQRHIAGFLCVDAWYGKLSSHKIKRILDYVSDYIYTNLQLLFAVHEGGSSLSSLTQFSPAIGWYIENDLLKVNPDRQALFETAIHNLQAMHSLKEDEATWAGISPGRISRDTFAASPRRTTTMDPQSKMLGTKSALPHITPEEFAKMQELRRRDPTYIAKLLDEAKSEFDFKWGIDPNSPTDYQSRI